MNYEENLMLTVKIFGSFVYSFVISTIAVTTQSIDNYNEVFTDLFFYISAIFGTAVMLALEKVDPKTGKIGSKRIIYSIIACASIVFIAGTTRASMLEDLEFSRSHWFYGIVMFACAIAPEAVRVIVSEGGSKIGKAVINRVAKGIDKENSDE